MKMSAEFRRFTNAVRKRGGDRYWGFVAEAEDEIVVVVVNRDFRPTHAAVLEALVRDWGGELKERTR